LRLFGILKPSNNGPQHSGRHQWRYPASAGHAGCGLIRTSQSILNGLATRRPL